MGKLVGFVIAIALLWGGGQGLYVWFANPEPTELSCANYLNETNEAEWLKLTDCQIDGYSIAFAEGEADSEIYVPIRATGETTENTAKAVALITDKKMIEKLKMTPNSQEFDNAELEGMVQFGIEKDDDLVEQLDDVLNVVSDPTVIVRGEKPNAVFSGIMFGIGVLIAIGLLASLLNKSNEDEAKE